MHLSIEVLDFKSQFKLIVSSLESLVIFLNNSFEVAHGLKGGRNSLLIDHLDNYMMPI